MRVYFQEREPNLINVYLDRDTFIGNVIKEKGSYVFQQLVKMPLDEEITKEIDEVINHLNWLDRRLGS